MPGSDLSRRLAIILSLSSTGEKEVENVQNLIDGLKKTAGGDITQGITLTPKGFQEAINMMRQSEGVAQKFGKSLDFMEKNLNELVGALNAVGTSGRQSLSTIERDILDVNKEIVKGITALDRQKAKYDQLVNAAEQLARVQKGELTGAPAKSVERQAEVLATQAGIKPEKGQTVADRLLPGFQAKVTDEYQVMQAMTAEQNRRLISQQKLVDIRSAEATATNKVLATQKEIVQVTAQATQTAQQRIASYQKGVSEELRARQQVLASTKEKAEFDKAVQRAQVRNFKHLTDRTLGGEVAEKLKQIDAEKKHAAAISERDARTKQAFTNYQRDVNASVAGARTKSSAYREQIIQEQTLSQSMRNRAGVQARTTKALLESAAITRKAAAADQQAKKQVDEFSTALNRKTASISGGNRPISSMAKDMDALSTSTGKAKKETTGWLGKTKELFSEEGGGIKGAFAFAFSRLALYSGSAAIIYAVISALKTALKTAVELDQALADLQGVLPTKSLTEALLIKESVIQSAIAYGENLKTVADSAKIFTQTGQSAAEVAESLNAALVAVRGANLDVGGARELIIAIENITKGEVEALSILDRISRVESRRAITANDLSMAIQRIGPLVRQLKGDMVGMVDEFDAAMGMVTTIVERTRVSGVNASTSLRFILSRFARPEVIKRVQQLSGVGIAREGGKELRPFVEVLRELSAAYKDLKENNKSGQAFELLGVIGGARQLQATAALLEDFSDDSLQTSRISALAFGDATERAAISLDTISTKTKQAGASFAGLASSVVSNIVLGKIIKITLEGVAIGFGVVTGALNLVDEAFRRVSRSFYGTKKFAAQFINTSSLKLEEIPRIKEFSDTAQEAGQTTDQLLGKVRQLGNQVGAKITSETGLSLPAFLEKLDDVATGNQYRDFFNRFGAELADGLAPAIPKLEELTQAMLDSDDPAEKAAKNAERVALAYTVLGQAAYASSALIATQNERLVEQASVVKSQVISELDDAISRYNRRRVQTEAGLPMGSTQSGQMMTQISRLFGASGKPDNTFEEILSGVDAELRPIMSSLLQVQGATSAWAVANAEVLRITRSINGTVNDGGLLLDTFAENFLDKSRNLEGILSQLETALEAVLIDKLPDLALNLDKPGAKFLQSMNDLLLQATERLIETNRYGGAALDYLTNLQNILTDSPGTRTEGFLETINVGFVKVRQKLLELLSTFVIAIDSANTLAQAYGEIGLAFDRNQTVFAATKTLFEGLSRVQNDVRKEFILTAQQSGSLSDAIRELLDMYGTDVDMSQNSILAGEGASSIAGDLQGNVEKTQSKLEELQGQLDSMGGGDLSNIFGGTEAGQTFLRILDDFLELNIGANVGHATLLFETLVAAVQKALQVENDIITAHQIKLKGLTQQKAVAAELLSFAVKTRDAEGQSAKQVLEQQAQSTQRLLGLQRDQTAYIQNRITTANALNDIEMRNIEDVYALRIQGLEAALEKEKVLLLAQSQGVEDEKFKLAMVDAEIEKAATLLSLTNERALVTKAAAEALGLKKEDILLNNIIDNFITLEQQIKGNITSATAGLRTVLTDFSSLKDNGLENILGPIGKTFIDRTAQSFVDGLINVESAGLMGKIARMYGSTPETRLKENLTAAFALGGTDIATKFLAAGSTFNAQLASILGVKAPSGGLTGQGLSGAESSLPQISKWAEVFNQAGALGGALGGAGIGGGGPRAQVGGQLGSTVGTLVGTAIGGALAPGIGALAGGLLGGLLGGGLEKDKEETRTALKKIEQNTRETADVLELERRLLEISRGAVNVPSTFTLPTFNPLSGGQQPFIQQENRISLEVNITSDNPRVIMDTVREEFGTMIQQELGKIGV